MNKLKYVIHTFLFLWSTQVFSSDACGRSAVVDHQEILVDTSTSQKGEGLRFFLDQDPTAKSYLDKYQEGTKIHWQNAALGTAGTGLILTGVFINSSSDTKRNLYVTGISMILVNFLVARTLEVTNEAHLIRAINEYNKRNLPRIHFAPAQSANQGVFYSPTIAMTQSWSF